MALHLFYVSLHGLPGALALAVGPFQFLPRLRARHPRVHRVLGRVYLLSVLVAAVMGLASAIVSVSGVVAQVGFLLLVTAWAWSGLQAYRAIRRRQVQLHRVWMIRNYALTLSAVLLRLFIVLGEQYRRISPETTFDEVYVVAVWSAWVLPLVVAEWFVVQRIPVRRPGSATSGSARPPKPLPGNTR